MHYWNDLLTEIEQHNHFFLPCIVFPRIANLLAERVQTEGQLLSDANKDLDQQKRLEDFKHSQREMFVSYSKLQSENQAEIQKLQAKVNQSISVMLSVISSECC